MNEPAPRATDGLVAAVSAAVGHVKAFFERPSVKPYQKLAHFSFLAVIVAILLTRLTHIGWGDVLKHLPDAPLFYVFLVARFAALPCADMIVYGLIWRRPLLRHFPAFVRKRVYNYGIAGYAGEAFMTQWASRTFSMQTRDALIGVKDANMLSAFTANFTTVAMIAGLAITGVLGLAVGAVPGGKTIFIAAFLVAGTVATVVFTFRTKLLHVGDRLIARILAVHFVRQIVVISCTTGMYAAAIPTAPWSNWLLFVALQLVVSRVPFLPNQELVYLTAALSLATVIAAPDGAVAAMLLTEAALTQALNVALFFATAHLARPGGTLPRGAQNG